MVDWVTEYSYVTEDDLTKEEFEQLLKDKGHSLTGYVDDPKKKKLTLGNGKVYFLYTQTTTMF